jgi:hypothetical protein
MRAWPLHVVFASILVGSLAAKELAAEAPADPADFEPAIIRVARAQGLAFREYTTLTGTDYGAMAFKAPGCSRPVFVAVLEENLDRRAILGLGGDEGDLLRYVYIDRSWDKPDRLAFYVQRMKYALLKTFRLTRYDPNPRILFVDAPSQCEIVDRIDWRNAWNRDYLAAMRADAAAATDPGEREDWRRPR